MVADNEKWAARNVQDSSKRNDSRQIHLKGLNQTLLCLAKLSSAFPSTGSDCEKVLLAMNTLKANAPLSIRKGRREGKVHSKLLLQGDKCKATITLCAEVRGHVPLPQARFWHLLSSTSDLNEHLEWKSSLTCHWPKQSVVLRIWRTHLTVLSHFHMSCYSDWKLFKVFLRHLWVRSKCRAKEH